MSRALVAEHVARMKKQIESDLVTEAEEGA